MKKPEIFNSVTHIVGAVLALAGLVVLVVSASMRGDAWRITSFSIYGATLFLLYLSSSLYHGATGNAKKILRVIDHQSIYLLIAGTYTPFTLVTLRGPWGWSLFGVVWGLAAFGVVLDAVHGRGKRVPQLIIYLLMGWLIVLALGPLFRALPPWGVGWLMAGGLFYTSGVAFYVMDRRFPYFHGVWHLFVLAGSLCHYFAVLFYI
ncbi:MAG: hemolysin III [Elusimicrobia bacterium GWA2_62_23]|nr:MAG: hemolysin III [Elusimicrobia bacterium GWA2_62_23]OGR70139.1 MAG: hemolysin III [Elusimicrobia bacterium GWC2_63_65]